MVLSAPIVTQALSLAPSAAKASDGRPSSAPPSVNEKVRPAAPLTKPRRETSSLPFLMGLFMAQPSRAARWMARTMRG